MPSRKKTSGISEGQQEKVNQKPKRNLKRIFILVLLLLGIIVLIYAFSKWFVVAWVDGQPVTKFEYFKSLEESAAGKNLKDQLIVEKLIYSEANKKGVNASAGEIDKEFKKVMEQIGTESMKLQLAQVGMSENDFKDQLQTKIIIRKLFGGNVSVSDMELNKYIEDQQALFRDSSDLPPLTDEEKLKLKEELFLQKIQESFSKWVTEVQNSSRVIKQ